MWCSYAFVALWMAIVVEGQRQQQYYNIHNMPITKFDCRDKILGGYYADPEVNCQMFHVCVKIPGQGVQDFRFLCPNETVFDQEQQICADSGEIDCASSGLFYDNFDLYRLGSAQAAKAQPSFGLSRNRNTAILLGPSTPSPLLTNNVVEEDDFYLQRSETGDRRLHAKDLLRGSSSSNLFNTRNGGKDLDDDDDDAPRTVNETPQSYRPKSSHQQARGKSQYNTQFRRTESPAPISTTVTVVTTPVSTTTTTPVPPRQEEKKRTKVAVRKLARKRVNTVEEKTTPAPSFTTQVTQKLSFGEPTGQRYNTINRAPATSSVAPQQPNRQYQNFRSRNEQSTPAAVPVNYQQQNNRGTTPSVAVNYQQQNRETTPAFQPGFQQNGNPSTAYQQTAQSVTPFQQRYNEQSSTAFQSTSRPAVSSTPAFFEPSGSPTSRPAFNGRPIVASQVYQSPQPQAIQTTRAPNQFNRGQVQFNQQQNRQGSQRQQPARQEFNRVPVNQNNQLVQQSQRNQPANSNNQQFAQKTQQQQNNQQSSQNNQQFTQNTQQQQQQSNQQFGQNNQQQFAPKSQYQFTQRTQQNTQQFNSQRIANPNQSQQFNQQSTQFNQQTTQQFNQYSTAAPQTRPPVNLPVVRAQTINAALQPQSTPPTRQFSPQIDDFEDNDKQEFLKTAPSSNFKPSDINSFAKSYKSQGEKSEFTKPPTTKYYTPTIVTTPKPAPPSSPVPPASTAAPASPARPAAPAAPARPVSTDDKNDYDYAYYDDGNTFSEYDGLDALNEQDFSRTSQRSKARLI